MHTLGGAFNTASEKEQHTRDPTTVYPTCGDLIVVLDRNIKKQLHIMQPEKLIKHITYRYTIKTENAIPKTDLVALSEDVGTEVNLSAIDKLEVIIDD